MDRRTFIAVGGATLLLGTAGCADNTSPDPEQEACSHVPDDSNTVSYELSRNAVPSLRSEYAPFVLLTDRDQIETVFPASEVEHDADEGRLLEDVDFSEQVVLVWEKEWYLQPPQQDRAVDVREITQPDDHTITMYGCWYELDREPASYHITVSYAATVALASAPEQATLVVGTVDDTTTIQAASPDR
ncbi:hypothetical protein OB905_09740 [Halobacteria archaeon AArc-dxtr1]|nr:hypothetical protein [Halobacteria archaeon AArc-dxtr1]